MRLWSLHPRQLDPRGLVALWREGLLAQKVLQGATRGYRNHPQLSRFRRPVDPVGAIGAYLREVEVEAASRGYRFDRAKIVRALDASLPVTAGQMAHEWAHLMAKLRVRSPSVYERNRRLDGPEAHPMFHVVPGAVEEWERP